MLLPTLSWPVVRTFRFGDITRINITIDFKGRLGEYAKSRCHVGIDNFVSFQLTMIGADLGGSTVGMVVLRLGGLTER